MYKDMKSLISELQTKTQYSVYAVYSNQNKKKCYSLGFPTDKNKIPESIINEMITGLDIFSEDEISINDSNAKVRAEKINNNKKYNQICSALKQKHNFKSCKKELLETNFLVGKVITNNQKTFLLIKPISKKRSLKPKYAFMQTQDDVEIKKLEKMYIFDTEIELIIDQNENYVYSLIGEKGFKTLNLSEQQKEFVSQNFNTIKSWPFLANPDFIDTTKRDYKYVYEKLYIALNNPTYLQQIQKAKPATVKANIQNNYPKLKDKKNFDSNSKLKLSDENLKDVMNLLGKGLKYNFFIGQAEDE